MPIYTNEYGLPPLLAQLLAEDDYVLDADYSATGLVKPPQIAVLERRYADHIVIDVAEEIWRFMGQAMHYVLSKTAGTDLLIEERIEILINGMTIQMTPDLYQLSTQHLWDYKFTSVWSTIRGVKPEWEQQINIYNYGLTTKGYSATSATILAILRDWSLPKAREERLRYGNNGYPEVQVKVLPVQLWGLGDTERFLSERVELHTAARVLSDKDLALNFTCSEQERWAKPTTYPVIRNGRALPGTAKFETREEAEAHLVAKGKPGDEVVKRWGEQTRCELYCVAAPFCHQFKQIRGE